MKTRVGLLAIGLCLMGCYQLVESPPSAPPPEPMFPEPDPLPEPEPDPSASTWDRPPLSGGSMALVAGQIVAGDASSGRLVLLDPDTLTTRTLPLVLADDPGRVAGDAAGRAHVVLRGTGEVLSLDPIEGTVLSRRFVCSAPRGIDYDEAADALLVACAGGELVTLPAGGGAPTRTVEVEPDLRDVIVMNDRVYVTRFRAAELLTLDADGAVIDRRRPASRTFEVFGRDPAMPVGVGTSSPNVAWRAREMPGNRIVMSFQRSISTPIDVASTGYAGTGMCPTGVVESAIAIFGESGASTDSGPIAATALAVDVLATPDGRIHLASAAGTPTEVPLPSVDGVHTLEAGMLESECVHGEQWTTGDGTGAFAVEALDDGRVVALTPFAENRFAILSAGAGVSFVRGPAPTPTTRGFGVFHSNTPSMVACASCHPEGGEDGHTWDFVPAGPRRTQTLLGGVLETAPFHWNGDQPAMHDIMNATFGERMAMPVTAEDTRAVETWLDAQPLPLGRSADAATLARGRAAFEAASCAGCHAGEALTNNENRDVGTGRDFQVPSLRGVMYRAPFLHDGCAPTLEAVLDGACGLTGHGDAGALTADERADLLAYLKAI